jgi:hypothetical protein
MKMGWDGVSNLRLSMSLFFILQVIHEHEETWWNVIGRGNRRTRRKPCPIATSYTTNSTWTDPGANQGLGGESSATNRLSHSTALYEYLSCLEKSSVQNKWQFVKSKRQHIYEDEKTLYRYGPCWRLWRVNNGSHSFLCKIDMYLYRNCTPYAVLLNGWI